MFLLLLATKHDPIQIEDDILQSFPQHTLLPIQDLLEQQPELITDCESDEIFIVNLSQLSLDNNHQGF